MQKILLACLVGTAVALCSMPLQAYEIKRHQVLSILAVDYFNACATATGGYEKLTKAQALALIEGSAAEDELSPGERIKHWHFYDRHRRLGDQAIIVFRKLTHESSLHEHFNELVIFSLQQAQLKDLDAAYVYRSLGRLNHYLQDVTVPAHVVPIFHPRYFLDKDSFDAYPVAVGELRARLGLDADQQQGPDCSVLAGLDDASFNGLLNAAADATLQAIQQPMPEANGKNWSEIFWSAEPSPSCKTPSSRHPLDEEDALLNDRLGQDPHCFGRYGLAGDNFAAETLCLGGYDRLAGGCYGDALHISPHVYKDFAMLRHATAIRTTVRAIALLQHKLQLD